MLPGTMPCLFSQLHLPPSWLQFSSVQGSICELGEKTLYAPPRLSEVSPQCCLWNSSNVRLTDDGLLLSVRWKSPNPVWTQSKMCCYHGVRRILVIWRALFWLHPTPLNDWTSRQSDWRVTGFSQSSPCAQTNKQTHPLRQARLLTNLPPAFSQIAPPTLTSGVNNVYSN